MKLIDFTEISEVENLTEEEYLCLMDQDELTLIVGRGECNTGGYDIRLKEVFVEDNVLTAVITHIDPDPAAFVIMVITFPTRKYVFHVDEDIKKIVIKKDEGEILKIIHI